MTVLYLASSSPQRQELLTQASLPYTVIPRRSGARQDGDVDERPHANEQPFTYVQRMATMKAAAGQSRVEWRNLPRGPVLGADTVVVLGTVIFGKPTSEENAVWMLRQLSGTTHQVLTALDLRFGNQQAQVISASEVTMRSLSDQDIQHYIASREFVHKAGAYGIQGRAALFIRQLHGSYSGVMGLPLFELDQLLTKLGLRSVLTR